MLLGRKETAQSHRPARRLQPAGRHHARPRRGERARDAATCSRRSLVNATFGTLVAAGLFVIGMPYALLFGFLGRRPALHPLRRRLDRRRAADRAEHGHLPGLDEGAARARTLRHSRARSPAPCSRSLLYARSAGVSEVGLLVALAFWTWVWGPIGLVLATPLTVCLVVFAKYIPELEFIWIVMGDEPVVSTDVARLPALAGRATPDEASDVVERCAAEQPRERVYDEVVLPGRWSHAARDRAGRASTPPRSARWCPPCASSSKTLRRSGGRADLRSAGAGHRGRLRGSRRGRRVLPC